MNDNLQICGLSYELISFLAECIREGRLIVDCNGNAHPEHEGCNIQHEFFNAKTVTKFGMDVKVMRLWEGNQKIYSNHNTSKEKFVK